MTDAAATASFAEGSLAYTLIKSKRRTLSVEVRGEEVIVRAPKRTSKREADAFVQKHAGWIQKHLEQSRAQQARLAGVEKLTQAQLDALVLRAKEVFPRRARHYAGLLGVSFGRITVRCQKTRWGSCSAKKNLNLNCLLLLAPPEVLDAVVAHEVCHLVEMNHSRAFYALLQQICPDYGKWNQWLRDNGKALMARGRSHDTLS